MSKGNWSYNYPKVIKFLEDNGYEYHQCDEHGQHLKVMGATTIIDLWPSRMVYHIIRSEKAHCVNDYPRLSYYFNKDELRKVLE